MKVIATCRTKNDEKIIGRYCAAYQNIADVILIADGGSTDNTIEVAMEYPKVQVLLFGERMDVHGGHKINPQGRHVNFLFRQAIQRGADWITFDDSDCIPNFMLQRHAREIMKKTKNNAIFTRRVYFWGEHEIFPKLHAPNTSLWAFRSKLEVRADERDPWHLTMRWLPHENLTPLRPQSQHLEFPYCLLHYSWLTPEDAEAKVRWYRESGVQPTHRHPFEWAGERQPADWFMRETPPDEKKPL